MQRSALWGSLCFWFDSILRFFLIILQSVSNRFLFVVVSGLFLVNFSCASLAVCLIILLILLTARLRFSLL